MERDAHYAAVGIATVALLAALAVFTIWLARLQFNSDYDLYDIVFYGPVNGLSEGGEVHFNGITGLNYIQITAGAPDSAILKTQYPENVVPVIQSQPSPIAELLSGSGTVLAQTVDALNRINRVMSDDNIRSFSTSVKNVEAMTTELEARKGMLRELEAGIKNANAAIVEYQGLAADTRQIVNTDGRAAIANINQATVEARQAIASINRSVTGLEQPLDSFATSSLPQLSQTIQELQEATRSLQSLVDDVRTSPRDFIGRPQSRELEVQP